ncbi:unnamed protein product [Gordionus sp. m RMFG-2023]
MSCLVPLLNHKNNEIITLASKVFKKIFLSDEDGELSLEVVRLINQFIKTKKFFVNSQVIDVFLWLKLDDVNTHSRADSNEDGLSQTIDKSDKSQNSKKHKKTFVSRKQFKKAKAFEKFNKDMERAEAVTSLKRDKHLNHTQIANHIFILYFKILRNCSSIHNVSGPNNSPFMRKLLASVLKGLSTFAHIINIDFFHDLIACLSEISVSKMTSKTDKLHAILTTFAILSGQYQSAFNIDLNRFYCSFYDILSPFEDDETLDNKCDSLQIQLNQIPLKSQITFEEARLVAKCIDACFIRRPDALESTCRVSAFVKRLASLCLFNYQNDIKNFNINSNNVIPEPKKTHNEVSIFDCCSTTHIFMVIIGKLLQSSTSSLHLFNTDIDAKPKYGAENFCYMPEAKDPDFCQSQNASLWEYPTLYSHFYDLSTRRFLSMCINPLVKSQIKKIKNEIDGEDVTNSAAANNSFIDKAYKSLINDQFDLRKLLDIPISPVIPKDCDAIEKPIWPNKDRKIFEKRLEQLITRYSKSVYIYDKSYCTFT